jgi:hypothetical protein
LPSCGLGRLKSFGAFFFKKVLARKTRRISEYEMASAAAAAASAAAAAMSGSVEPTKRGPRVKTLYLLPALVIVINVSGIYMLHGAVFSQCMCCLSVRVFFSSSVYRNVTSLFARARARGL